MDPCHQMAKKENIKQRQTVAKASKERGRPTVNGKPPQRAKKAQKATAKGKTFAGRPVRELERKPAPQPKGLYPKERGRDQRVIHQQRFDQNQPCTAGMAKGQAHQMDAFGNNVGWMATERPTMIITAIGALEGHPHDRQTIQPWWEP